MEASFNTTSQKVIQPAFSRFLANVSFPVIQLLVLVSFFFFLSVGEWLSSKVFRAGLIGQIVVGLIYGAPLGNVLPREWQEAFIALGYIGLILIIFEGASAPERCLDA